MPQRDARHDRANAVVIFDLDGTLIDTMPLLGRLAAELLATVYAMPRELALHEYMATCGRAFAEQLEMIAPGHARNADAAARFEARKLQALADIAPSTETESVLHELRAAGYRIAISSNNTQAMVDRFVERCAAPIDVALGRTPCLAKGPSHFRAVARALGCTERAMTFVGDSLFDACVAGQAAIRFIAKLGTFRAEEFGRLQPVPAMVRSLDEIPGVLEVGCAR